MISVLILVGGQSLRMGQDKALLPVAGVPLLQRVYRVALALAPTERIFAVSPWPTRYRALVPEDSLWVVESNPQGPLSAVVLGLSQVTSPWVLVLACDMPWLDIEILRTWQEQLAPLPEEILAFVPQTAQGFEPLCGFYRRSALASLQAYGGRSLQGWLAQVPVGRALGAPEDMFTNCNTPAELAEQAG